MCRIPLLGVLLLLLLCSSVSAKNQIPEDAITLNLPESVIAQAIAATLPLDIDPHSSTVSGTITIAEMKNIQLNKDLMSCDLHLIGNNIQLETKIAGHAIQLKVGHVEINFKSDITTRFDRASQKLFIKPTVTELGPSSDQANGDIGRTLIALISGKEFPISLDKIDPLVISTGNKDIFIAMEKIDIALQKDALQIFFTPKVSTATEANK